MKSHFTCPYCCQLMEIDAEGKVMKVGKVSLGDGQKDEDRAAATEKERNLSDVLWGQLSVLEAWNKQNVEAEPEQVRKNIETIVDLAYALME